MKMKIWIFHHTITNSIISISSKVYIFTVLITVCDEGKKEACQYFLNLDGVLHWNISSPASDGSYEEKSKS